MAPLKIRTTITSSQTAVATAAPITNQPAPAGSIRASGTAAAGTTTKPPARNHQARLTTRTLRSQTLARAYLPARSVPASSRRRSAALALSPTAIWPGCQAADFFTVQRSWQQPWQQVQRSLGSMSKTSPESLLKSELLDVAGAARYLGVTVVFVRRLVLERRIRYYKLGKFVRFRTTDLDAFVEGGRIDPTIRRRR